MTGRMVFLSIHTLVLRPSTMSLSLYSTYSLHSQSPIPHSLPTVSTRANSCVIGLPHFHIFSLPFLSCCTNNDINPCFLKQAVQEAATIRPRPLQVDLRPFDLESHIIHDRVMYDVGYLCANFSLPRPLCSRLRPDVRDRQTSERQTSDAHHSLMPPPYGVGA